MVVVKIYFGLIISCEQHGKAVERYYFIPSQQNLNLLTP
jgi:hypothetical protein